MLEDFFKDWMKVIDKKELIKVLTIVDKEYKTKAVCPKQTDIFKAFKLCSLDDLKIVMLGQDPYPQKGVATGLLFGNSVDTPEDKLSPSLQVIKEAVIQPERPHGRVKFDNTMEAWAEQGILMINSALTVEEDKISSHMMIWRPFIVSLLKNLSEYNTGIIYVLFGNTAKTFKDYIGPFNNVIIENHPAYYARNGTNMSHNIFNEIETLIKLKYNLKIKWYEEF